MTKAKSKSAKSTVKATAVKSSVRKSSIAPATSTSPLIVLGFDEQQKPRGANFVNAFIAAILAESGLSILGLGPQQDVTLGVMIYWALSYGALLQNLWWWWATPVLSLIVVFLSLYLIHVGLDEVSNPRLRGQKVVDTRAKIDRPGAQWLPLKPLLMRYA